MPGTIGTFNGFTGWSGRLRDATRRTAILPHQAGYDGNEVARDAWGSDPVTIVTTSEAASVNEAASRIDQYRSLMNASNGVIVTEPIGWQWDGVIVLGVAATADRTITGTVRITTTWSLLPPVYLP